MELPGGERPIRGTGAKASKTCKLYHHSYFHTVKIYFGALFLLQIGAKLIDLFPSRFGAETLAAEIFIYLDEFFDRLVVPLRWLAVQVHLAGQTFVSGS